MDPQHVLVIEDDQDVLDLLDGHLTRLGCRVVRAADGETGVALARADPPDVVFVDMVLPGIDGREVARRLRADPHTAGSRIVVTSVLDSGDVADQRFDGVLAKPFRRTDIEGVLATVSAPPEPHGPQQPQDQPEAQPYGEQAPPQPRAAAHPDDGGASILLADDDEDIRELVAFKLEAAGFQVLAVDNGPAALAAARDRPPALVVLDVMMPGLSGIDVCRALRADAATAHLPVILLTARAQEGDVQMGFGAGADDYVVKPFSPRELVSRVEAVLARAKT